MQKFAIRLIFALSILLSIHQNSVADTYPKREMRAGWVATVWNLDWPKGTDGKAYYDTSSSRSTNQKTYLRNMIQNLKETGFNAVNFQVRGMCDAMYKSSYEPWSSALTNTRGKAPSNDWDPLAYCIEVCHELGMECHAWVNPFRFSSSTTLPSTTNDMTLRNNGWILTYGSTSVLNPAIEEARNYIVESVCKEIIQKYDIDGMVWDDYFYPNGIPSTSEAQDYTNYQSYKNAGGTMSIGDWRRNNVNTTVKMAFDMIQREKPYVKFGISPAGVANEGARAHGIEPAKISSNGYQYNGIFADPCAWIIDGYIDYVSPQLYWLRSHQSAPFDPLCEWWNSVAATYGVQCYISHDIAGSTSTWSNTSSDYTERYNQILQVRATAVDFNPGQVFYSAGYLNGPNTTGFGQYLKENIYQYPAIPPKIVRDNEHQLLVNPGKVSNLTLNSTTLSWTAVNSSTKHRYAVYAIPLSIGVADASSSIHTDDGGFKAEYLIDVTFNSSLSGVPTGSYWYAVTAIDRYGYEWEAATLNAPKLGNVSLALDAPTSGVALPFGDNSFSWTSDGDSFLFQISTSEDFNRPLIEEELTNKSYTLNITPEVFEDGGTYYWRVVASKDNYNSAWSEVRSFTIEPRPFIPLTLLSPENNSTIDSDKITFEWEGIEGATYTFEIAEYSSFNTILRTATLTNTNYSLDKSSFTGGKTYFWRVKAVKDGYQPSISNQASFKTPKVEGELVDGISIENLWIKSVSTNNFPTQLANCVSARTMAEYNGHLYILERANDTECYLLEFDGKTCEFLKQIPLTGDIYSYSGGAISSWDHKAGQCIFSDGNGNLYISCLAIASEVRPLTVCSVNVSTGATSKIFEANKTAVRHRIDYVNATGNLNATGGQIWAATTDNTIYRWTRNSNGTWTEETTTINDYHPNIVTALGTAPYIQPISTTQFVVDGAGTHPALYTFNSGSTATLNSSFADNAAIEPTNAGSNGTCSVTIGNTPLFVYVDDNHNGNGHSFSIVANKHNFDFSQFQFMKSVPENKLGTKQNDFVLDQPVAIKNEDGSATIFLYAPNNGLAAYRISLPEIEISLNSPADNVTFEEDFDFSWNSVEGANYTLEISKTSTFENIVFEATTTATSYNSSNFNFASETQYFWRVKASHPNYTSATSEVRQFTSPVKQSVADNLTIEELWNFSVNKNNFPSLLNKVDQYYGPYHRTMTAYNGNLYITYRESSTKLYLLEFSSKTGEHIRQIQLTGDCVTGSYGANCVFVDDANHLCVATMGTSSKIPVVVCTVDDLNTGKTTERFTYGAPDLRIDYVYALGDVTKEGGQIWGGTAYNKDVTTNNNHVYRWTRKSDGLWDTETTKMTSFLPSTGHNGTAPYVMPISTDKYIIDGGSNYPTLYPFNAGTSTTLISGFESNSDIKPRTISTAGMNQLTIGKYPLFIYSSENYEGAGYNFDIVHNPSLFEDFADMELLWTIPNGNLGDIRHSSVLNSIATIKNEDNSATVFVYAPLNGLAAYRISLPNVPMTLTSPINNTQTEDGFDFVWTGVASSKYTFELSTSESFNNIVYTTTTENSSISSSDIKLAGSTKYYWRVTAVNDNYTTTTSSVGQFISPALPEMPITLVYPKNNIQTSSGFDFAWTGVDDAEYTLELSSTPTFESVAYSSKTNIGYYSSNNFPFLPNATTYYWRVTGTHDDYSPTISAVESFITPAKPSICKPVHYLPYDKESFNSDIVFVAIKAYLVNVNTSKLEHADNSILEISKDPDFTDIIYTNNQWIDVSVTGTEYECIQHTLPISFFTNGTYYWRIHAQEEGYDDVYSEPYSFIVEGQRDTPSETEENYIPKHEDNSEYLPYESSFKTSNGNKIYYTLTNLWIRNSKKNDIEDWNESSCGNYRGFCTRHDYNGDQDGKDIIWVAYHNGSDAYLEKYDAANGEYLGILNINDENLEKSTYPCNDVFVDGGGNLCIMNLKNYTASPYKDDNLQIAAINPKTGKITHSVTLIAKEQRIDHARIVGNITNGTAYVFAACANSSLVYRWKLEDGVCIDNSSGSSTIPSFYPSTATSFGTAPRIYPVDHEYIYIDGYNTAFTLYKFVLGGNLQTINSFETYNNLAPISNQNAGSGGNFFMHSNSSFIIYPISSFSKTSVTSDEVNYQFYITKISSLTEWGGAKLFWTIPSESLGTNILKSGDVGMLVDYLQYDALTGTPKGNATTYSSGYDRTNIYIYVPGNGIAAYALTQHIETGAENIDATQIKIGHNLNDITFGCDVDQACIYTLSGMMVNAVENASSIEKPATKGVYILQLTINGVTTTHKIVI